LITFRHRPVSACRCAFFFSTSAGSAKHEIATTVRSKQLGALTASAKANVLGALQAMFAA
jgi:hypothetical protein